MRYLFDFIYFVLVRLLIILAGIILLAGMLCFIESVFTGWNAPEYPHSGFSPDYFTADWNEYAAL